MRAKGTTIVVDIGKTLSKVSLWTADGRMLDRKVRANDKPVLDGLRRLDIDGIGNWLIDVLREFSGHPIETIVPVGHGAAVVAIRKESPAFAPLDYEQAIPEAISLAYDAIRDGFCVTGSPSLPDGLNIGRQLFWLEELHPGLLEECVLLPWAQYWAWFLTGVAVSEVTSLGCHSDLWSVGEARYSPLAKSRGWAGRFARVARASERIGGLRSEVAAKTGLPASAQVLAGIHDSNAALLAARGFDVIARKEATILSTGTWFIAMRLPGENVNTAALPEHRDTLVNIDANGWRVPSARFMGGREIEMVIEVDTRRVDIKPDQPRLLAEVPEILARGTMLMPTLAPGYGPFPDGEARWIAPSADWEASWYARRAAVCLYAALVADSSLDLIGSKHRLLIEGRFAEAEVFVRALAALRPDTEVYVANAHNDVSFGAMRLINPLLVPIGGLARVAPLDGDLLGYRARWREALASRAA